MTTDAPNDALTIRRADLDDAVARALIQELNEELTRRYPEEGATHFRLDREEVAPGRGAFLVAMRGSDPVGCGAVRRFDPDPTTVEVKRMYTRRSARGQGAARAILQALEAEARALGAKRMILETGTRQPEAVALYRRAGFTRIEPWGEYIDSPTSICMEKLLD